MKRISFIFSFVLILCITSGVYTKVDSVNAGTSRIATVVVKKSKNVKQKQKIINTKKQLINSIIKHVTKLDKNIRLKISRKAIINKDSEFSKIFDRLTESVEYNEIMSHAKGYKTSTYDKGGKYYYFTLKTDYKINKAEAKTILAHIQPIIKTKEELIKSIVAHTENLDEEFSINVDNRVLSYNNQKEYNALWDELYAIPEINDIVHYSKGDDSDFIQYKNYFKWKTKIKYDITRKEVADLNNFVQSWVAENIKPEMTEEEKARAINDFMVKEYRYTYGEKKLSSTDTLSCPGGNLGKYSVYTSFALLYGKGGVCDAKAKMFYRLAKAAGLDVIYITGNVDDGLHAWNLVKIDGNWYHLDNTWNRGQYDGSGEYDYFETRAYYLKGDATMSKDHSWDRAKYPAANADYPLGPEQALPDDPGNSYDSFSLKKAS